MLYPQHWSNIVFSTLIQRCLLQRWSNFVLNVDPTFKYNMFSTLIQRQVWRWFNVEMSTGLLIQILLTCQMKWWTTQPYTVASEHKYSCGNGSWRGTPSQRLRFFTLWKVSGIFFTIDRNHVGKKEKHCSRFYMNTNIYPFVVFTIKGSTCKAIPEVWELLYGCRFCIVQVNNYFRNTQCNKADSPVSSLRWLIVPFKSLSLIFSSIFWQR